MGQHFSQSEYKEKLGKFGAEYLTLEHSQELDHFLQVSDDFTNVFTSVSLEDFRAIKESKTDNIVHIVAHVSITSRLPFGSNVIPFLHLGGQSDARYRKD